MEIFTPNQLWADFDPTTEQLDIDVFADKIQDGISVKKLYFNGSTFPNGRKTRVLCIVCRPVDCICDKAVVVVGDYTKPVCVDDLKSLASQGFVVASVDYAGRGAGICTIYPSEQDKLNADVADSVYFVGNSVKDNKIYEYVKNTRRAVSYVLAEESVAEVSVVGVGCGAHVGTLVLGTDSRIARGTVVFGKLYEEYPLVEADNAELSERLAEEDVARAWTMGLAPQSYLMQITAPLYAVLSANSANVDIVDAGKMYYRVNDDSRLLILPTTLDYLPQKYIDSVVAWLNGATVAEDFDLTSFVDDNGDYNVKLVTDSDMSSTSVWYCVNPAHPARYWDKAKLVPCEGGFTAKLNVYKPDCDIAAFCLIDGKVAVSSSLTEVKVRNARNVKLANNVVFSGEQGQNLIPVKKNASWWGQNIDAETAKGYLGIVGMKGNGFATFGICDPSVRQSDCFTVSFDVCADARQKLTVEAVCNYGTDNTVYTCTTKLIGDGKWQRITVEAADLHRADDSRPMSDDVHPDCLQIFSEDKIIVNNIILV